MAGVDIRDAFFEEVYAIAAKDKNVIFLTADADAFTLKKFKQDLPEQFLNVHVAEQNMVTVSAGLALCGKKVYIYSIIPFITLRCFEQVKVTICSMNLPITIVGAGAGLSFNYDGPTHHAVSDIAIMRTLPEITIFNPSDPASASASARLSYELAGPAYVRLDKGVFSSLYNSNDEIANGMSIPRSECDICIISTGIMAHRAREVARDLSRHGISAEAVDIFRIKPLNSRLVLSSTEKCKGVVVLEENSIIGGLGSVISELFTDHRRLIPLKRIALPDEQCFRYGSREWLHKKLEIDNENIMRTIISWWKECKLGS